jgi:dTDP-4-dehydrorhamnose reductase
MAEHRVLIVGAQGQLGYELRRTAGGRRGITAVDRADVDIADAGSVQRIVQQYRPGVIINAAAYTAVDQAEQQRELAWAVNCSGAENLAVAASAAGARLLHVSTDFVFDGNGCRPCRPQDGTQPRSVYAASKAAGERAVLEHCDDALVVRTSWLYSAHGHNFVKTMLRLMAERDAVSVVADQVGTPTWARVLAETLWSLLETDASGICHCSNNGVASWYDFAVAIQEEALAAGLLRRAVPIKPISTAAYPLPARRPVYSVLDVADTETLLGVTFPHWRESLRSMLKELQ